MLRRLQSISKSALQRIEAARSNSSQVSPHTLRAGRSSCRASRRDGNHLLVRHFADRIARPLAAEAALFDASVRHSIYTRAGGFVDMDRARLDRSSGQQRLVKIPCKYAGSQAIARRIDGIDRLAQSSERQQRDDRREDLLLDDLQSRSNVTKDSRLQHRT